MNTGSHRRCGTALRRYGDIPRRESTVGSEFVACSERTLPIDVDADNSACQLARLSRPTLRIPTDSQHNLDMSICLSLVIPAFNETQRLPRYLAAIRSYLPQRFQDSYEVIVVDDGSSDGLLETVRSLERDWSCLRTLQHPQNLGKGAAVRTGMLAARGDLLLFADADGATPIDQEARLSRAIEQGPDIAVGSRLVRSSSVVCSRSLPRAVVGRLFAIGIRCLMRLPVRDTQCGFKLFRREAGRRVFEMTTESGYLFDIEILLAAAQLGYRIVEVPIQWSDQPGSQLNMVRESWRIFGGLWQLRRRQTRLGTNMHHGGNAT